MAIGIFQVANYYIRIAREFNMTADGLNLKIRAVIIMEEASPGGGHLAQAFFLDDTSPVPRNSFDPATKRGNLFLPRWQFEWFVDLLRNEKPVSVLLDSVTPRVNSIFTGAEPPGEGE
jgi:hypothetical protein